MELCGRALYNLLRINWLEDPRLKVKPWQVEDYRALSTRQLLDRLSLLRVVVDEKGFLMYAEGVDSPEALTDLLWVDEEMGELRDQIYLVVFELWRRLLLGRQSLSIFCDELDQLIEAYDQGHFLKEDQIGTLLRVLENLLDEGVEFSLVAQHLAHDLPGFLYDYIADLIENDEDLSASEWLEAFYPHVNNKKLFDILRVWLLAKQDVEVLNQVVEGWIEEVSEETDSELFLEMARFLVHRGDLHLFVTVMKMALEVLTIEEHLQRALQLLAEYYRCLDRDEHAASVLQHLTQREEMDGEQEVSPTDKQWLIELIR